MTESGVSDSGSYSFSVSCEKDSYLFLKPGDSVVTCNTDTGLLEGNALSACARTIQPS